MLAVWQRMAILIEQLHVILHAMLLCVNYFGTDNFGCDFKVGPEEMCKTLPYCTCVIFIITQAHLHPDAQVTSYTQLIR